MDDDIPAVPPRTLNTCTYSSLGVTTCILQSCRVTSKIVTTRKVLIHKSKHPQPETPLARVLRTHTGIGALCTLARSAVRWCGSSPPLRLHVTASRCLCVPHRDSQDAAEQERSSFLKLLRCLALLASPPRPNSTPAQLRESARRVCPWTRLLDGRLRAPLPPAELSLIYRCFDCACVGILYLCSIWLVTHGYST